MSQSMVLRNRSIRPVMVVLPGAAEPDFRSDAFRAFAKEIVRVRRDPFGHRDTHVPPRESWRGQKVQSSRRESS